MKTIKLKTLALALAFAAGAAVPVSTSIAASWMDDYFNSAGASSNATNPNFFKSQTQNTLSLGGFSYRAPMRSTQLFAFSPPGYKAGCGGIDAWLGAYGFVNMDAFVNALRNIGQNAVGYFFQLALKTMAPEIDGLLTELSSKMQQLNQMQINNCQLLKTHFSSPTTDRSMDFTQRAQAFGSAITGGFESMFSAVEETKGSAASADKAMNDACSANAALCVGPDGKPYLKRDTNIAYDAMDETGLYSQSEIELYMSLFGTLVYRQNKTDDTKAAFSVDFLGPLISWESFLGTKSQHSLDLPIYKCPDSQCLLDASTLGIETTNGWTAIVHSILQTIRTKVFTRSLVDDPKAIQLIGMSSVPIYQLISQSMAASRGSMVVTNNIIESFTDYIAVELAYKQLIDIERDMNDALTRFTTRAVKADEKTAEKVRENMRHVLEKANQAFNTHQAALGNKMRDVAMLLDVQRKLYTGLGPRLMANMEFGKR